MLVYFRFLRETTQKLEVLCIALLTYVTHNSNINDNIRNIDLHSSIFPNIAPYMCESLFNNPDMTHVFTEDVSDHRDDLSFAGHLAAHTQGPEATANVCAHSTPALYPQLHQISL